MQKPKERSYSLAERFLALAFSWVNKDPAIVVGEVVELFATLDKVGIPVHE